MTPYEIRLLLHFFTTPDPPPKAPILDATCQEFCGMELLKYRADIDRFEITERGEAYCRALQRVSLPVKQWVIPASDEVVLT